MTASERDREMAARCWCHTDTERTDMDPVLAERVAEALAAARLEGARAMQEACAQVCDAVAPDGNVYVDGETIRALSPEQVVGRDLTKEDLKWNLP